MARLNIERQQKLEPKRIKYAIDKLKQLGLAPIRHGSTKVVFEYQGETVSFFPYSGWHSGKSIQDGRGLEKLLKQLKSQNDAGNLRSQ